jgi:hypothetical protein
MPRGRQYHGYEKRYRRTTKKEMQVREQMYWEDVFGSLY